MSNDVLMGKIADLEGEIKRLKQKIVFQTGYQTSEEIKMVEENDTFKVSIKAALEVYNTNIAGPMTAFQMFRALGGERDEGLSRDQESAQ